MALVSILRKFKFERAPDTEVGRALQLLTTPWTFEKLIWSPQVPLKTRLAITLGPVNGIHLKVVARV